MHQSNTFSKKIDKFFARDIRLRVRNVDPGMLNLRSILSQSDEGPSNLRWASMFRLQIAHDSNCIATWRPCHTRITISTESGVVRAENLRADVANKPNPRPSAEPPCSPAYVVMRRKGARIIHAPALSRNEGRRRDKPREKIIPSGYKVKRARLTHRRPPTLATRYRTQRGPHDKRLWPCQRFTTFSIFTL